MCGTHPRTVTLPLAFCGGGLFQALPRRRCSSGGFGAETSGSGLGACQGGRRFVALLRFDSLQTPAKRVPKSSKQERTDKFRSSSSPNPTSEQARLLCYPACTACLPVHASRARGAWSYKGSLPDAKGKSHFDPALLSCAWPP